jgi:hypothetical protein
MIELVFYIFGDQAIVKTEPTVLLMDAVKIALKKNKNTEFAIDTWSCFLQYPYSRYFLDLNSAINEQKVLDSNGKKTADNLDLENNAIYLRQKKHLSLLIVPFNPYR